MICSTCYSYYCLILFLCILSRQLSVVLGGSITAGPVNTAGLIGTEVQLNCTATLDAGDTLSWHRNLSLLPIGTSNSNVTENSTIFDIERDLDSGGFNLIVKHVEFSLATRYDCFLVNNYDTKYAQLVALGSVECPVSGSEFSQGTVIDVQCGVQYSGAIVPHLNWTDSSGAELGFNTSTQTSNSTFTIMTVKLELDPSYDEQELTCSLDFQTATPDVQNATPTYTDSCTTSYLVTYPVTKIQLSVDNSDEDADYPSFQAGDVINCTANGRPAPTYIWINEDTDIDASNDSFLEITTDMVSNVAQTYTCNASNTFNNETISLSSSITFYVVDVPADESGVEVWVIVVAVVVPVVVIVAVVIGAFFGVRHHRKKKKREESKAKEISRPTATSYQQNNYSLRSTPITTQQPVTQPARTRYDGGPGNLALRQESASERSIPNDDEVVVRNSADQTLHGFPAPYTLTYRVPRPESTSTHGSGFQPSYARNDYDPSGRNQSHDDAWYNGHQARQPIGSRNLMSEHDKPGFHDEGDRTGRSVSSFNRGAVVMNPNPSAFRPDQLPVQFVPRSRDYDASSTGTSV